MSYLENREKNKCFGCEACVQICPKGAITMKEDKEGFRYPIIDEHKCIKCNMCKKVCPCIKLPSKFKDNKLVYGGYNSDWEVRKKSTSGGIFSSIVDAFCDKDYVIFGATSKKLKVYHTYINDKEEIDIFRKSKYSQSIIGNSYKDVKNFLKEGKKVLFSGTPCHIAGLKKYLMNDNTNNLLTVEVICEGVPSPHYMQKMDDYLYNKYDAHINDIDYRYKDNKQFLNTKYGKWDFQVMHIKLQNNRVLKKDRWFNPFWKIWLDHLMSRPSCYTCPFTTKERIADITLGDLWGIHLYCPELYGKNNGASLIICNSIKGYEVFKKCQTKIYGHELDFDTAIKYQSPLRKSIADNPKRNEFMNDLESNMNYQQLIKKWYQKPSIKLLFSKYIWGNRQKIFIWNLRNGGKNE